MVRELINTVRKIEGGKAEEKDFDTMVLENKAQIKHPTYLVAFMEILTISPTYYKEHRLVCDFFYAVAKCNELLGDKKVSLDVWHDKKIEVFTEDYEKFLKSCLSN